MWSNEPCTLPLIVELVTGWMKRPAPQVVAATTRNAMTFFRLYKQPHLNIREDIWIKRPAPQVVAATTRNAMTFFRLYKQPNLNIREDIWISKAFQKSQPMEKIY